MELSDIVPLTQDNVELFRLFWPPDPNLVQARAGVCLVVMVRQAFGGGVLVAMPSALVPVGSLPLDPTEDGTIGPHTRLEVPGVRLADTGNQQLGIDIDLHLVDLGVAALAALTPLSYVPESEDHGLIGFGEDLDVLPDPVVLVERAQEWLSAQVLQRVTYYSAVEDIDGQEMEDPPTPVAALPPRAEVAGITPPEHSPAGEALPAPTAKAPGKAPPAKEPTKAKRTTNAALAEQLTGLMDLLPAMTRQIAELQQGQMALQASVDQQRTAPPVRASQMPIAASVAKVSDFAKMMGGPPRTKAVLPQPAPPLTMGSGLDAKGSLQEQAEETSPIANADPFARAMLEQSRAIMTLVASMQQGGDPLLDMPASSSGGSLGTRGSQGRERLQRDLATKSGNFFLAVLQNAAKRLKPAGARPASIEEVASTDFSMIHYLERFGGFGQFKELGLIQYALAHIFDALVHSDLNGARDYLALLMVGVDQANLDNNRWELAYRMMLLEEPPSQLWAYRNQSYDPRSKSFSPLAPQQWTTVALAYSKEMDYIQTKRQEVTQPKQAATGAQPGSNPYPKKRGRFPKSKANPPADAAP